MLSNIRTTALAASALAVLSLPASAAGTLDEAVEILAHKLLIDSRICADNPPSHGPTGTSSEPDGATTPAPATGNPSSGATGQRRIAVTPFLLPDHRTTAFTNFLMTRLTGQMIEVAGGHCRVVERAQIVQAIEELEVGGVFGFDKDTAGKVGQFLNVNTLIVGEMNPLGDRVHIDARMIDVETVLTMEQGKTWVPLTPSTQEQLAQRVVINRMMVSDDENPGNGVWNGRGQCGDTVIGLALALAFKGDNMVRAMQTYYPVSNSPQGMSSGSLLMEGTFDPGSGELTLKPGQWVFQPQGHGGLEINGQMNFERGQFAGAYVSDACPVSDVNLRKMD